MKTIKKIILLFSIIGFIFCITATAQTGDSQRCHLICEQVRVSDYVTCMNVCREDNSCFLVGEKYPEGTIYGPYVCRQGEWMTNQCILDHRFYSEGETYGHLVCLQGEWVKVDDDSDSCVERCIDENKGGSFSRCHSLCL